MELLARYLQEVRRYLPRAQQDDILAEMSDTLQSQIEDKDAQLGRPLTTEEESDLLKAYGHPKTVASRYYAQQYLIGPALFPFYLYTLKFVFFILFALAVAGVTVRALTSGDWSASLGIFWGLMWGSVLSAIGGVTLVFALIEYWHIKHAKPLSSDSVTRWDPRSLPAVTTGKPVSRVQSVIEIAFMAIVIAWLAKVPAARSLIAFTMQGPGGSYLTSVPFTLTGWWHDLAIAWLIVAGVTIVADVVNLIRPEWTKVRAATQVATNAFLLILVASLFRYHTFIMAAPAAHHDVQQAAQALNAVTFVVLIVFVGINALMVVLSVRPLLRRGEDRLAAAHTQVHT